MGSEKGLVIEERRQMRLRLRKLTTLWMRLLPLQESVPRRLRERAARDANLNSVLELV